jgi:hypothetical protein
MEKRTLLANIGHICRYPDDKGSLLENQEGNKARKNSSDKLD